MRLKLKTAIRPLIHPLSILPLILREQFQPSRSAFPVCTFD